MTQPGRSGYPIPISPSGEMKVYRAETPLLTSRRRLCSVLEELAAARTPLAFHGMPWMTPILGTGCLDLGDGPSIDVEAIAALTRSALAGIDVRVPRELGDPGAVSASFVDALHRGRTHRTPAGRGPLVRPSESATLLTLVTALLTQLFHGACLTGPTPTSRWWTKETAELSGDTSLDLHLRNTVLPTALTLIRAVESVSTVDSTAADAARRILLHKIGQRLTEQPATLQLEELRLVTEVTWLELIRDTSIYPGWSDLLLQLLMNYSEVSTPPAGHRPKVLRLDKLGEEVAELLKNATEHSWTSRTTSSGPHERDNFYAAIAQVLHAQAGLFRQLHVPDPTEFEDEQPEASTEDLEHDWQQSVLAHRRITADSAAKGVSPVPSVEIPLPVAFVTSFDLETEMALWAIGRPFRVVLPILATSSRRVEADLLWLTALIDPERHRAEDLNALTDGPHEWRLAKDTFRPGVGGDCPIVVRLSGSPLTTLPPVASQLREDLLGIGFHPGERIALSHALTIDEYTSIRQSENELFFAARNQERGLPQDLSRSTKSNDRVWVAMGVQIDDPAIRNRMFTQLSVGSVARRTDRHEQLAAADRPDNDSVTGNESVIRGLAVNQRIDENESTALHWLGFRFVLDVDCASLTKDIEHCASHLQTASIQAVALATGDGAETGESDADWARATSSECDLWSQSRRVVG